MSGKKSSENTLYLIQASYAAAPLALSKLQRLYTSGNQVVLMGESVMHAAPEAIQALEHCYVLECEQPLLNSAPKNIQLINYEQFAALCLQFTRCISIK